MMLGGLSIEWSMIFAVLALMGGFVVGQGMHAVMGPQGFGSVGNMIVLATGFYIGLMGFEATHLPSDALELRFAFGVGGAFLSLFVLAVLKRILIRI